MNSPGKGESRPERRTLAELAAGEVLGPITVSVSAAANERYWRSAGVDHPLLAAGALYPPIAANLTILLLQTAVPGPVLHARQRLTCHRRGSAAEEGTALGVSGSVAARYEKRGREYAEVEATVSLPDGSVLWTSQATFAEAR